MKNWKKRLLELSSKLSHAFMGWLACVAIVLANGWAITLLLGFYFWRYEWNEEKNLKVTEQRLDPSYQEFREFLIGAACGVLGMLIWSWPKCQIS